MATFRIRSQGSGSGPTSVGGRIAASLFYLVFAGMGLVVTGFFFVAMKNGMVSWGWEPAQCRVLTSQVEELLFALPPEKAAVEQSPYQLAVTYQWERDGRTHTGSHVGGKSQFGTRGARRSGTGALSAGRDRGLLRRSARRHGGVAASAAAVVAAAARLPADFRRCRRRRHRRHLARRLAAQAPGRRDAALAEEHEGR